VWRSVLLWTGPVLEAGVLAGLIVRRRLRRAWLLPVLLVALMLSAAAVGLVPWAKSWPFWFAKELGHALLFLALGIEIAMRTFASLPGARRTLFPWLAAVVVMAVVLALTLPLGARALAGVPRLLAAVAFLYGGVYGILRLHVVPVDPLHKAVLLGFAPYLLFNAVSWGQVRSRWEHALANVANPALFVLVLLVLLVAAWREETPPRARPSLVRRLWPWR
jgi:hypothetical protein